MSDKTVRSDLLRLAVDSVDLDDRDLARSLAGLSERAESSVEPLMPDLSDVDWRGELVGWLEEEARVQKALAGRHRSPRVNLYAVSVYAVRVSRLRMAIERICELEARVKELSNWNTTGDHDDGVNHEWLEEESDESEKEEAAG